MSVDNPKFRTSSPDIYLLLKENARKNRANMTEAEKMLWERLRCYPRPLRFRRQHIIGDYIVDFVCLEKMLVVEVDGEYHSTDEQKALDELRTEYLNSVDFSVVRFTNEQVINHINDVVAHIEELIYK
ncbi:MAG: endonuclease domain-containing protein [Prevotellaceae bacterium]|nr:endonuclease domain-containing protein [Prevotellaceae bacterium]